MTLVITAVAALVAAIVFFTKPELARRMHVGALALMYTGASLMWCVDGFASMAEGEAFIELSDAAAMRDDALLGVCVVALGLVAWGVINAINRNKVAAAA